MQFLPLLRYGVFAVVLASTLISIAAWAVRSRQVSPFSGLGRLLRSLSEPLVKPVEGILLRNGGNPQNAPLWIFLIPLIAGIALIALANWLTTQAYVVGAAAGSGRTMVRLVIYYAVQIVLFALIARVIGSWIGQHRYSKWMRPAYLLTDWIVEPLRRIIPPMGGLDLTPLVAWFLLQYVILRVLMSII